MTGTRGYTGIALIEVKVSLRWRRNVEENLEATATSL
ncbi:hypothetical protein GGD57_004595 [Rhizobium esperanzae]|uniref:Uncharacterized protein n=1 Tax=Rhizobium esperanzae TaxID=1967781 RepID=A0A7W6R795_9HYPH|nr:hypothetical protein [Rhizobium esperanzae]